jgi:DNA gyrase subunit A
MMRKAAISSCSIEEEVKTSYLNYAMSVIVSRALPDVRDGLKPVHRRLLYAMEELGLHNNAPTKKSARITGDAMGKYHPHGDLSLYDALVRMAQDFSLRYPCAWTGNFVPSTGPAAASRYTERNSPNSLKRCSRPRQGDCRLCLITRSLKEPSVLPSRYEFAHQWPSGLPSAWRRDGNPTISARLPGDQATSTIMK